MSGGGAESSCEGGSIASALGAGGMSCGGRRIAGAEATESLPGDIGTTDSRLSFDATRARVMKKPS